MLRRLELEFIGEEGFVVVKKILEENLVSQEVIKFIEAEKNKMTVDKLNAYLKSQNVYGKIIGKVNIAFRKK
jgi:proline dehydrogenase